MFLDPEKVGKLMFGRALRLRVMLWVADQDEAFFQQQAAKGLDYSGISEVAKELAALVDLGMLRRFGRPQNVGRLYYQRIDSPLWAAITVVAEALASSKPKRRGASRGRSTSKASPRTRSTPGEGRADSGRKAAG